jgi:hypothetical protein
LLWWSVAEDCTGLTGVLAMLTMPFVQVRGTLGEEKV